MNQNLNPTTFPLNGSPFALITTAKNNPNSSNEQNFCESENSFYLGESLFQSIKYSSSRFKTVRNSLPLKSDILNYFVKRQKINRPRNYEFVTHDWRIRALYRIKTINRRFQLSLKTYYLSIAILDRVISKHFYKQQEYNIILVSSIIIAIKLNDNIMKMPDTQYFLDFLGNEFTKEDIYDWETKIMVILDFRADIQTIHDFTEYFLEQGVLSCKDFSNDVSKKQIDQNLTCLDELILCMLEVVAFDFRFYKYTPLGLAAGMIACARELLKMEKWTLEQQQLCQLSFECFLPCYNAIKAAISVSEGVFFFDSILKKHFDPLADSSLNEALYEEANYQSIRQRYSIDDLFNCSYEKPDDVSNDVESVRMDEHFKVEENIIGEENIKINDKMVIEERTPVDFGFKDDENMNKTNETVKIRSKCVKNDVGSKIKKASHRKINTGLKNDREEGILSVLVKDSRETRKRRIAKGSIVLIEDQKVRKGKKNEKKMTR